MAKMLQTFASEGKKDLKRIPEEFIISLSEDLGNAFLWVAKGRMSDLNENNENDPVSDMPPADS